MYLRDAGLPEGALVALIARGRTLVPPRGSTKLEAGDHLFVLAPQNCRDQLDVALRR
jgi:cell volume regulation protein A